MRYISALIILLVTCYMLLAKTPALALTMTDNNYILQWGTLETAAGASTGSKNKINISVGQIAPGLYSGTNYKVRSGFQYINSIYPFRFQISLLQINFGTLTAGSPVTRTSTLTVSNSSAGGYTVSAFENNQLLVPASGALIPDTSGDNGNATASVADTWTNPLTYGFGYNCVVNFNANCGTGFTNSTYYKRFPDQSRNLSPQVLMSNATQATNSGQVAITYKVNISTTQAAGLYTNLVSYIATPTF